MNSIQLKEKDENLKKQVQQLTQGEIVSNYKELCIKMGEEVKGGTQKASQLKNWQRFMDFEKIEGTQKYLIKEIYEYPKAKESTERGIYVKLIEMILLCEFKKREEYTCHYTKTQLFQQLGMINDNYLYKNRERGLEECSKYEDIAYWDIEHFMSRTSGKLHSILMSAFKSLSRRCVLNYNEQMIILERIPKQEKFKKIFKELQERDEIDKEEKWEDPKKKYFLKKREAEKEEIKMVLDIQSEVLKEMELTEKPWNNMKAFKQRVDKKLQDRYNWETAYKEYVLVWSPDYLDRNIGIVKQELESVIKENKLSLNGNIIDALNLQAKQLKVKNEIEYPNNKRAYEEAEQIELAKLQTGGLGKQRVDEYKLRKEYGIPKIPEYKDNYILNQQRLTDIFIKIEGEKENE